MNDFWGNIVLEIALLTLLGVLYYFYQKRKIIKYEKEKGPMIIGLLLESCLTERGDTPDPHLDPIIEALDDYLHGRILSPPTASLRLYAESEKCSMELKSVIENGLMELE